MEIHQPESPLKSWKDFAVHIFIVTLGILIALGLEGIRETWREHQAVAEARDRFSQELRRDQHQLGLEMANVRDLDGRLTELLADLPKLAKTPGELARQMKDFTFGFYFFRSTAWESAVASGVVAHMSAAEVNRFADVYTSLRNYQEAQKMALPEWIGIQSFFRSREVDGKTELSAAREKLWSFEIRVKMLGHVAQEFSADIDQALTVQ